MRIAVAGGTGTVGRLVVDVAAERRHETVVLSRSTGVDLSTSPAAGTGLETVLQGVDAVVDVLSTGTQSARASAAFYRASTTNLLAAEERAGVGHHVALSIVGVDRAPFGYYAGKVVQEALVAQGRVPWTLLRATQFHEFAGLVHRQFAAGPLHLAPAMRSAPVAALEVAQHLVTLAEAGPSGRVRDLAGPEVLEMAEMVRAYDRATGGRGLVVTLPLPGGMGRAFREGAVLPGPDADRGTQTFGQWIQDLTPPGPGDLPAA